jgi:hypothetical protein
MLNDLRQYHNLGTPNYFFQLLKSVNDSENSNWSLNDLDSLFYNKIIDDNHIFDGCIDLAVKINVLTINGGYYTVNNDFSDYLNSVHQMKDKFVQFLFLSLKNEDSFHKIFQSQYLSYDIIYKSFQINNSAFGFKFKNFRQLLIDFGAITTHPTVEFNSYILNSRFKKLFDKTILPEIKKRKIGVEEFRKAMELQQIYGEEAEKFVVEFENKRLSFKKDIDWVAQYIVNEGYDVASYNHFDDSLQNRFIEVKSYDGDIPYFFWSRNEYKVARRKKEKYWVYLVNRKRMNDDDYKPLMEQNPFDNILKNDNWDKEVDKYIIKLNTIKN